MFDLLDAALKAMLDDPAIGVTRPLFAADISFVTPEHGYAPGQETVNLFLYETKENRVLREAAPIHQIRNGSSVRRMPPLRVDCSYLVTTWSKKTGADKVAAEHRLLGQALMWLSRFPVIPAQYLTTAGIVGQPFPPPTLVAQMDGGREAGEFWHALGIAPRPYFHVVATIALDLELEDTDALVTTTLSGFRPGLSATGARDERVSIGGVVLDGSGNPLPDAWVRLEPDGVTTVTDAAGRFTFPRVQAGVTYTLRARAAGLGEASRQNIDVSIQSGDYNVQY